MRNLRFNKALLLNLLFPPRCAVCREVTPIGTAICYLCMEELLRPLLSTGLCEVCGKQIESCVCREGMPFYFSRSAAAFLYLPNVHNLIHSLKTCPQSPAAEQIALLMAKAFTAAGMGDSSLFSAVTEVPMSAAAQAERGHNQAETLARKLAEMLNIPYLPSPLCCEEKKRAQHTLSYAQRFENVKTSYSRREGAACSGRILLIDDVTTTGATLDCCARLLLQCGADKVYCLTAATTPRWGDAALSNEKMFV